MLLPQESLPLLRALQFCQRLVVGQSMSGAAARRSWTYEFGIRVYIKYGPINNQHVRRTVSHLVRGLGVTLVCTLPATCSDYSDSVYYYLFRCSTKCCTLYLGNSCSHFDLHRPPIQWNSVVLLHCCNYSHQTRSLPKLL